MKLQAKFRLQAFDTHELPNRGSTQKTEEFLKFIQTELKRKGFTRKTGKQSALYHWDFTRERDGRRITIDGWHGTGAYGGGKTLFGLYDNVDDLKAPSWKIKQVIDTPSTGTAKQHDDNLAKATAYIKAVK